MIRNAIPAKNPRRKTSVAMNSKPLRPPAAIPAATAWIGLGASNPSATSHICWQLSDEHYRNSGFVHGKGSDDPRSRREIRTSERLLSRLEALAQREYQRETTR
jgi:hypothetical protein